jgi:hypothetical protein
MQALKSSIEQTIARPTLSAVVDPFRDIIGLPSRVPSGFKPAPQSTAVDTIIDHAGDGVGPLSVSTACNHLFCYVARYEDKRTAVMLIAGDCALEPLSDGRIHRDLALIHHHTLYYGPIVFHSLTTVITPKSTRGFFASSVVHRGQTGLLEAITQASHGIHNEPPPPISLLRLKLSGWLPYETSVPTCIFQERGHILLMRVAWGKNASSAEHVRIA